MIDIFVKRTCQYEHCRKTFDAKRCRVTYGDAKFCTSRCYGLSRILAPDELRRRRNQRSNNYYHQVTKKKQEAEKARVISQKDF